MQHQSTIMKPLFLKLSLVKIFPHATVQKKKKKEIRCGIVTSKMLPQGKEAKDDPLKVP